MFWYFCGKKGQTKKYLVSLIFFPFHGKKNVYDIVLFEIFLFFLPKVKPGFCLDIFSFAVVLDEKGTIFTG